jgi:hypothetical protein
VNASESVPRVEFELASELPLDLFGVDVPHVDGALQVGGDQDELVAVQGRRR